MLTETIPAFGQVDLTNCDREPIHVPGSIQPHGVLLAFDMESLEVVQVAGDTERLLGVSPDAALGSGIESLLGRADLERLRTKLDRGAGVPRPLFVFETAVRRGGELLEAVAHTADGLGVIELAPHCEDTPEDPLILVQGMVSRAQGTNSVDDFCQAMADQVRGATGFDRVMVYRFLPDDSGMVVAEARQPDVAPYLGLHYPASDIPRQARELYRRNWMRLIPDAAYRPAPLVPALNPRTGRPLDLGHSMLRSVSPLHLEYLANMGVAASMSLSLVVRGELWGLIACHHGTPRFMGCRRRAACELFAQLASLQLEAKVDAELSAERVRVRDVHHRLVTSMSRGDLADSLIRAQPNLLDYIKSGGVAVCIEGKLSVRGEVPAPDRIDALVAWLDSSVEDGVFATDNLSRHYPEAAAFGGVASGLLALSVSRRPRDYVLWFRPEYVRTQTWAGNPVKPVEPGGSGGRLTPRKSFEAWRETVHLHSRPWQTVDLEAAQALRVSILETVLQRLDEVAQERASAREQQDLLMAELDHRVKNTLAMVTALVEHSSRTATSLADFTAALRARIHAMASAHSQLTHSRWQGVMLCSLIEEELASCSGTALITLEGPDLSLKPKAALAVGLALHELVTNAVKYGALSVPRGQVAISWKVVAGPDGQQSLELRWAEREGPPVEPPTRAGFGRQLLERIFAYEVDGGVDLTFAATGVVCTFRMAFEEHVAELASPEPVQAAARPTAEPKAPVPTAKSALDGMSVLLVEDNALVAMAAQDALEDAGAEVTGPASRVTEALKLADGGPYDAALLDVDLRGEPVWPVADALTARGVPISFTTGYDMMMVMPDRFREVPVLNKPYSDRALVDLVVRLAQDR